jgi:hypothetical protein
MCTVNSNYRIDETMYTIVNTVYNGDDDDDDDDDNDFFSVPFSFGSNLTPASLNTPCYG